MPGPQCFHGNEITSAAMLQMVGNGQASSAFPSAACLESATTHFASGF